MCGYPDAPPAKADANKSTFGSLLKLIITVSTENKLVKFPIEK